MRIELPSTTPAELALPEGSPSRGLVVIPDIFGLRPLFDALVARLATEQGWAVCAIEPFPGLDLPGIEERFDAMPGVQDERLVGDAIAAADVLTGDHGCGRVGVLGFCMGGMYTLKAAASRRFDRAVAFYGMIRVPLTWRGPGQAEPLAVFAEHGLGCPVLAVVGGQDPYTPEEDIAALEAVDPRIAVIRYPDAEHGFVHDPDRPAHRPADAADAWSRAVTFLA